MKEDLTGRVFRFLTVLRYAGKASKYSRAYTWECRCICGKILNVRAGDLNRRQSSCGCKAREIQSWKKRVLHKKKGTYDKDSFYNRVISIYVKAAIVRGIDWNLTREHCIVLFNTNCFYCGSPPSKKLRNKSGELYYTYTGIDRMDSNKGYVPDNVTACCHQCNYAKGKMQFSEFFSWISRIVVHFDQVEKTLEQGLF